MKRKKKYNLGGGGEAFKTKAMKHEINRSTMHQDK